MEEFIFLKNILFSQNANSLTINYTESNYKEFVLKKVYKKNNIKFLVYSTKDQNVNLNNFDYDGYKIESKFYQNKPYNLPEYKLNNKIILKKKNTFKYFELKKDNIYNIQKPLYIDEKQKTELMYTYINFNKLKIYFDNYTVLNGKINDPRKFPQIIIVDPANNINLKKILYKDDTISANNVSNSIYELFKIKSNRNIECIIDEENNVIDNNKPIKYPKKEDNYFFYKAYGIKYHDEIDNFYWIIHVVGPKQNFNLSFDSEYFENLYISWLSCLKVYKYIIDYEKKKEIIKYFI